MYSTAAGVHLVLIRSPLHVVDELSCKKGNSLTSGCFSPDKVVVPLQRRQFQSGWFSAHMAARECLPAYSCLNVTRNFDQQR